MPTGESAVSEGESGELVVWADAAGGGAGVPGGNSEGRRENEEIGEWKHRTSNAQNREGGKSKSLLIPRAGLQRLGWLAPSDDGGYGVRERT